MEFLHDVDIFLGESGLDKPKSVVAKATDRGKVSQQLLALVLCYN